MQRIRRAKALAKTSQPADPLPEPAWTRPLVGDSFYLHELGLSRECFGDCPAWVDLPPVIRRARP
ncbi:hypothetical protein DEMA109039_09410 [Deinococcus marmoris]